MGNRKADLVLADAVVHLPGGERVEGWVSAVSGRIEEIGTGPPPPSRSVRSCDGAWVLPGLVDIHVHFRDPGATHKEDFVTGSAAAAAGGVTTVIDMPNTGSLVVSPDDVREKIIATTGRSHVDFGLYALLVDSASFVQGLVEVGAAGLKWLLGYESLDGRPSQPSGRIQLRDTLARAGEADLLVGIHAEDVAWIGELADELRALGRTDPEAHGESRPPFVEALAIAEALVLGAEWGARLHIHHLSSELGLRTTAAMQDALGCRVTIETCPHYLLLTDEALSALGTSGRVNPPLRRAADAEALWRGITAGDIDCIASDHAPHAPGEKRTRSVWDAHSGLIGVETTFPLMFHEVVCGRLSVHRFVELTAMRPAEIVGLGHRKGKLEPGFDADLLVVDADASSRIDAGSLHSKHRDSAFQGRECQGRLEAVYLRGEQIVEGGRVDPRRRGVHVPSHGVSARR